MSACSACGRPARPLAAVLLAMPVIAGALSASLLLFTRGTDAARAGRIAAVAVFAALVGGLVWFASRLVTGAACGGCGRGRSE